MMQCYESTLIVLHFIYYLGAEFVGANWPRADLVMNAQ